MMSEENRKDILDSFLETIKWISDTKYQKRAWIQGEPPGTDFDETVNYYSDGKWILENYKDFGISESQFQILRKFDEQFRGFYENNNWPPAFINTPEWTKITLMAKQVLEAFNYHK